MATCFCGEDLNDSGECWQGKIMGGHQGNCVACGKNAELDGMRCCSVECDQAADPRLIFCDDCQTDFPAEEVIECGHCGDTVCSGCLIEHAKGHSQV
jgi:hypothetical protein